MTKEFPALVFVLEFAWGIRGAAPPVFPGWFFRGHASAHLQPQWGMGRCAMAHLSQLELLAH